MTVELHPADAQRFDDVALLLGPSDPDVPACWCLSIRLPSGDVRGLPAARRPEVVRELCGREPPPGLLAYVDGEVAGWCGLGPHGSFGRLLRSRTVPQPQDPETWSAVCFVIRATHRRQGLAERLLGGAVELAEEHGAPAIEGYPVDNDGRRMSSSFAYVGTRAMFERQGFTLVAPTTSRSGGMARVVMRRQLRDAGA